MTAPDFIRRGAIAAIAAGVLGVLGDLYHATQDRVETSILFKIHGVVLIAALIAAVFALIALQLAQGHERAAPGGIGFWLAFAGTILVAGDIYYEVAVQPRLAGAAPAFLEGDPEGWHLAVVITSFALFGVGWLLTGVSLARSRMYGLAPALVLAVGGLIGFTPVPGSYLLWSLGLILVGVNVARRPVTGGDLSAPTRRSR